MYHNKTGTRTKTNSDALTLQVYMNPDQLSELVMRTKKLAIKLLEKRRKILNDSDLYGVVSCISLFDQSHQMTFWEKLSTFRTHVELSAEVKHEILYNLSVFIGNNRKEYKDFYSDPKRSKKELRLMDDGNLLNHSDVGFWESAVCGMRLNSDQKKLLNSRAYPLVLERHFYPIRNLSKTRAMYYPDAVHCKAKQKQINEVFNNPAKVDEICDALFVTHEMACDVRTLSDLIFDYEKVVELAGPDLGIISLSYSQYFEFDKEVKNLFYLVFDKYKDLV